ncbi:13642_t:CDS:2, partial [Dentiscutata heterogama]
NAFPYEVPKWMPEVLVKLAECISDPAPIQATVKNTFADFKRTLETICRFLK